jgi:hypothetical protein
MTSDISSDVLRFVREHIDTVPHLEALLLIWESAPKTWTADELSKRLYVDPETGRRIIGDLARRKLVAADGATVSYNAVHEFDSLLPELARTYRRQLVQITRFIHAKGSSAMQEFARAFKLKKDE